MIKNLIKETIINALPNSYILMFHHITSNPEMQRSSCLLNWNKFTNIINLKSSAIISVDEIIKKNGLNKIALTFDDGLKDVYDMAYPYLKKMAIPFTIFIVTDFIDKEGYITRDNLIELSNDPLVTVGAHGCSHERLGGMSYEKQLYEIIESKKLLSEIIGREVNYFAYSHGSYDDNTLEIVNKYYKKGFSVIERPINLAIPYNKLLIPRLNVDEESYNYQCKKIKIY